MADVIGLRQLVGIAAVLLRNCLIPGVRKPTANARRQLTDAEIVTLCVAQAIMGIATDDRFIRTARYRLKGMFRVLPSRDAFHKRRARACEQIEAMIGLLAKESPGFTDDLLLVDSTPVESARSLETVKRSGSSGLDDALGNAADYGWCASHSRLFYGFHLHVLFALDGIPRALALASPNADEKAVCAQMIEQLERDPDQNLMVISDKSYRGKDSKQTMQSLNASLHRPRRKDEKGKGPHLAPIRQRI